MTTKKTLSKAASKFALGVTDFLGIRALPGTEQFRDRPQDTELHSTATDEVFQISHSLTLESHIG